MKKKKKTKLYWLLAYNLLFFQAYDAKHVKKYIFLPSLDLVGWQTNIRLIGKTNIYLIYPLARVLY
jgi:hypothetical protein